MKRSWDFKRWMYPVLAAAAVVMALCGFYALEIRTVSVGIFVGLVLICFVLAQAGGVKMSTSPFRSRSENERGF